MHVLQRFRRRWICVCIWMGHTVAGIPHKPAKKEALRMSRRGPPSDTPCSSLLLHSCNTPRKQKQRRENGKKWKKKKNNPKVKKKSKKPKEVVYWEKKPKLNEQMASCCQKDTEPGNIYLNYFHCDRFPNHSDSSSAFPGWDLGWCIQSYLAS